MKTLICLAASLFPFATFIVDQRILKLETEDEAFAKKELI